MSRGERYDVAVVGAGPAGSIAARELALGGARVLLVDRARFPRDKVCGGCLHPRLLARLAALGLGERLAALGPVPTRRVLLAAGRRHVVFGGGGASVSRRALDATLADAAREAGAHFLDGTRARLEPEPDPLERELHLAGRGGHARIRAAVVVAATGLGAPLADGITERVRENGRLGAGTTIACSGPSYPPGEVAMACARSGYVGVVRLEDGALDVAAALDAAAVRDRGPGVVAAAILDACDLPPIPGLAGAIWRGTPALTRRATATARDRVVRIGDAAGYVEPFTGEGMAWAVESALAAAPLVRRALEQGWSRSLERALARRRRGALGRRTLGCALTARALRHPRLLATLARILERAPVLARPLATGLCGRDLPPVGATR